MTDRADDEPWYFTDLLSDVSVGDWVSECTSTFDGTVTALVPGGFETYSRVLHPARMESASGITVPVRWSTVADALGAVMHQSVAWGSMIEAGVRQGRGTGQGSLWTDSPQEGELSVNEAEVLGSVLAGLTTTPDDCFFGFWEGVGLQGVRRDQTGLVMPGRKHLLVRGAVADVSRDLQGFLPHVWWPADRAWFVATDVDLTSTYVGGSTDVANTLAAEHPGLECVGSWRGANITWTCDTINPRPPEPYSHYH
ncbi:hypothetical protein BJD99_00460 [Rhodococcus sp. 1163]|uniref:hypothetical protein n=1 Tax=Rhodococcus sp. 1163 TaxID=1905289 RepID=UPI000A0388C6|nr:hypothetical protein [Rhodococcus sp. 1163]ORI20028.1 hypothetical protein BJD99_00460 [Rhodococcus sp. 1163]